MAVSNLSNKLEVMTKTGKFAEIIQQALPNSRIDFFPLSKEALQVSHRGRNYAVTSENEVQVVIDIIARLEEPSWKGTYRIGIREAMWPMEPKNSSTIFDEVNRRTAAAMRQMGREIYMNMAGYPEGGYQIGFDTASGAEAFFERVSGGNIRRMPPQVDRPSKTLLERCEIAVQDVDSMMLELAQEAESLLGYSKLRTELKAPSPLAQAFKELEIKPYSDESVKKYKDQMLAHAKHEAAVMDERDGVNPTSFGARQVRWTEQPMRGYPKPIPAHVINTAVSIAKLVPSASFHIDEMTIVPDPFLVVKYGTERYVVEVWDEPTFSDE